MKYKRAFPFFVLLLCFLLQGGILGVVSNCRGLFYTPVCTELGIELGEFTAYSIFYGLAVCFAIPPATRLIQGKHLKGVLTASGVAAAALQYSMGWFYAPWQWYIAAALQGVCYAMLFVQTVPMLIDNWFAAQKGLFLGIACSASSVVGAVMNTVTSRYMELYGWRASYRFMGIVMFLLMVPATVLFAVGRPEEIGARAYGADRPDRAKAQQEARDFARKELVFFLLIAYSCVICLVVGYNQVIFPLAQDLGYSAEKSSLFVSAAMVSAIPCKLLVGWINDRFGAAPACYVSGGCSVAGLVLLYLGKSPVCMMAGALCIGMLLSVAMVVIPNLVRSVFGGKEFQRRYQPVSIGANLATNFSFSLTGWLVSLMGSYQEALKAGTALAVLAMALTVAAFGIRKRSWTD